MNMNMNTVAFGFSGPGKVRAGALSIPLVELNGRPPLSHLDSFSIEFVDDEKVKIYLLTVGPDGRVLDGAQSVSFPSDVLRDLANRREPTAEEALELDTELDIPQEWEGDLVHDIEDPEYRKQVLVRLTTLRDEALRRLEYVGDWAKKLGLTEEMGDCDI
ncbi:MAG: hypothetical protein J0H11_21720 [Rhizobiales bacterium]|nr:hypothetical protein [Hyphomicrobiales bacterium]